MISELFYKENKAELQSMLNSGMIFVTTTSLAAFIAIIIFGDSILSLFGDEFKAGHHLLIILATGQLINALAGPAAYILGLTGAERTVAKTMTNGVILNIALNYTLIPFFGPTGAAIATTTSVAFWNISLFRNTLTTRNLDSSGLLQWLKAN